MMPTRAPTKFVLSLAAELRDFRQRQLRAVEAQEGQGGSHLQRRRRTKTGSDRDFAVYEDVGPGKLATMLLKNLGYADDIITPCTDALLR